MAGRITVEDRERVREANRIDKVIGEYVALKNAGGGNLKGLCPFHDERTPSFQVSPGRGRYHCFGCGQGGDVFEFIAELEHLTFVEAVQRLADKAAITLTMVEGGTSTMAERGTRSRLIAANKAAAAFYAAQLATPDAAAARDYLTERGFDDAAAVHFGCGFAPAGWDDLFKALTAQGFTLAELEKAGLVKKGQRGPIDNFRRRLLWAIQDAAGDVVGFGARRIFDDDHLEAKYVNTAETALYRKSSVLFGLNLAKRDISKLKQAVIVEGYTDVMAMHLAGITTAVASCGTAFGDEHISILRRYLLDSDVIRGEVIYTFDGDNAGQKAALKAFDSDQKFTANTYVATAPDGMDPCELRQAKGDAAVRQLVAGRTNLFEFAIKSALDSYNLNSAEGRVAATAATIPLVARIKDSELRSEYARRLAGWLGAEDQPIVARVRAQAEAVRRAAQPTSRSTTSPETTSAQGFSAPAWTRPNPADQRHLVEREALKLVLQHPVLMAADYPGVEAECFVEPAYAAVHAAVQVAGGPATALGSGSAAWVELVRAELPVGPLRSLVTELAVDQINHRGEADIAYAGAILAGLQVRVATRRERDIMSDLRRAEANNDSAEVKSLTVELMEMAAYRRALAERASGNG